jgi:hypothetical protein
MCRRVTIAAVRIMTIKIMSVDILPLEGRLISRVNSEHEPERRFQF